MYSASECLKYCSRVGSISKTIHVNNRLLLLLANDLVFCAAELCWQARKGVIEVVVQEVGQGYCNCICTIARQFTVKKLLLNECSSFLFLLSTPYLLSDVVVYAILNMHMRSASSSSVAVLHYILNTIYLESVHSIPINRSYTIPPPQSPLSERTIESTVNIPKNAH